MPPVGADVDVLIPQWRGKQVCGSAPVSDHAEGSSDGKIEKLLPKRQDRYGLPGHEKGLRNILNK